MYEKSHQLNQGHVKVGRPLFPRPQRMRDDLFHVNLYSVGVVERGGEVGVSQSDGLRLRGPAVGGGENVVVGDEGAAANVLPATPFGHGYHPTSDDGSAGGVKPGGGVEHHCAVILFNNIMISILLLLLNLHQHLFLHPLAEGGHPGPSARLILGVGRWSHTKRRTGTHSTTDFRY